jgi:hypothetical protein
MPLMAAGDTISSSTPPTSSSKPLRPFKTIPTSNTQSRKSLGWNISERRR